MIGRLERYLKQQLVTRFAVMGGGGWQWVVGGGTYLQLGKRMKEGMIKEMIMSLKYGIYFMKKVEGP